MNAIRTDEKAMLDYENFARETSGVITRHFSKVAISPVYSKGYVMLDGDDQKIIPFGYAGNKYKK